MTKITKFAAVSGCCAHAGRLASVATSTQAEAKWKGGGWGPAIGLGIAAGCHRGVRPTRPARVPATTWPPGYTSCRYVERYDFLGQLPRHARRSATSSVTEFTGAKSSARSARPAPFHPRAG